MGKGGPRGSAFSFVRAARTVCANPRAADAQAVRRTSCKVCVPKLQYPGASLQMIRDFLDIRA